MNKKHSRSTKKAGTKGPQWKPIASASNIEPPSYFVRELDKICFGKYEVEVAAKALVRFFSTWKGVDAWRDFSLEELGSFLRQHQVEISLDQALFGLITPGFDDGGMGCWRTPAEPCIVQVSDSRFSVTTEFIRKLKVRL